MCTIIEAQVPAERFALGRTLRKMPDAEFESVRVAASGTGHGLLPLLRASTDSDVDLAGALSRDPSTERVEAIASSDDSSLFHVVWEESVRRNFRALVDRDAALLDARCANGHWWFRLLFPERDRVSATYDRCAQRGIDLELECVSELTDVQQPNQLGITGQQFEAMQAAYESGYYEVPRKITLTDLASETDVSHQALSERFRRGHRTLIENALDARSF